MRTQGRAVEGIGFKDPPDDNSRSKDRTDSNYAAFVAEVWRVLHSPILYRHRIQAIPDEIN